jgi:hypothetical protein
MASDVNKYSIEGGKYFVQMYRLAAYLLRSFTMLAAMAGPL